jgi:alkylation response protein AidB-like acyl-CoA dehydrogenase
MLVGRTEEQVEWGRTVRSALTRLASEPEVRRLMATADGVDADGWRRLRALGLLGIAVPENLGGSGGTFGDQAVVLEEMGRCLYPGPYFSTAVLAVQALLRCADSDGAKRYLGRIIDDGAVATLALPQNGRRWDAPPTAIGAEPSDQGWRLSGETPFVPDGATADLVLIPASTVTGTSLFAVDGDAEGLRREVQPTMDQTRKQARLCLSGVPGRLLGQEGAAGAGLTRTLQVASVALAADQIGGAAAVLELVLAHVRTREQFGRPIGSFQVIQHRCADMLLDVEAAKSAAYYAAQAVDTGDADLAVAASLAKAYCSAMYRRVTDEALQLFGGIGLTWDHPMHLYLKRARSEEILLGPPAYHREIIAELIGL